MAWIQYHLQHAIWLQEHQSFEINWKQRTRLPKGAKSYKVNS
jgi:hypothetical protein